MRAAPGWIRDGVLGERVDAWDAALDLGPGVQIELLAAGGVVGDAAEVPFEPGPMQFSENDFSIALEVSVGDFELFTAGDLNGALQPEDGEPRRTTRRFFGERFTNIEQVLLDTWTGREADVEVYRANHHGSRYSTTQPFLDALDPELIVYSTGGQYGHPTRDVVQRGAQTAEQLVTSAVSATTWPGGLPAELGRIAGEVVISVDHDGAGYVANGVRRRAFSDADEAGGADSAR